uniref:G-protein coupled receptors family 1 profile domain-containing protein n=1 Tax=Parascaris equorum TaxID=6256 RepID=A0A914S8R9_PAREQ
MSSQTLCSLIIEHYAEATSSLRTSGEYLQLLANSSSDTGGVSLLNRITYAYIAPLIIAFGIIGDVMTVTTLTHPLLRRANIIYTYLILLAMTDFMTLISVIPMILWLLDRRLCTYSSALYYAHIGFPLVNALMGASVWIVVFLTMSQYMAVPQEAGECEFIVCERKIELWFKAYEWIRETISRLLPFVLVAYFNSKILITYRVTKKDRLERLANNSRKSFIEGKSEQEERRLFIIRAIINVMEFTKFALNFYFYCLINPDIRRQPVNPVSQYTRSIRSIKQENNNINNSINNNNQNGSSRRSLRNDDRGSCRKNSIITNDKAKYISF